MKEGTLSKVAKALASAASSFEIIGSDESKFIEYINSLGWTAESLPPQFAALASKAAEIQSILDLKENEALSVGDALELMSKVRDFYELIHNLNEAPQGVAVNDFLPELKAILFDNLLIDAFASRFEETCSFLELLGFISENIGVRGPKSTIYHSYSLNIEAIGSFLNDPSTYIIGLLGWRENEVVWTDLFDKLNDFGSRLGLKTEVESSESLEALYEPSGGFYDTEEGLFSIKLYQSDEHVFKISALKYVSPVDLSIVTNEPYIEVPDEPTGGEEAEGEGVLGGKAEYDPISEGIIFQLQFPDILGDKIEILPNLFLHINYALDSPLGIILKNDGEVIAKFPFIQNQSIPAIRKGISLEYTSAEGTILLGSDNSSRLEFSNAILSFSLLPDSTSIEALVELEVPDLKLVLNGTEGDGFVSKILGDKTTELPVPLTLIWSSKEGLKFKGGNGFRWNAKRPLELGPLKLDQLGVALSSPKPNTITATATAGLEASIGPFFLRAGDMGVALNIEKKEGNAGPFDIRVGFKLPKEYAFSIESDSVKGGGYLYLNPATGKYAGVADLGVGKVRVKALGVLEPVPGGGPGYSLLFLVYGEFKPVPLGLGFSLSGVGGLLGAHRSAHLERLRDGVRTGALAQLLFPTDPVRQAPGLLAQAGAWFPAAEGRYVFGLMGKVGWGRPKELLTLDVGVAVELPAPVRVAVFGVLRCELPNKDKPLVKLQAAFLGSIDTGTGQISFDATIYDSRLLQFTLSGDIAFRLHPGPRPLFVLSAGGFHPLFQPPAGQGLGQLRRMAIALSNSGDLTLLLTSYLAVTSNTVQLGSRVDFRYRINSKWDIVAFLGFDALVQLSPVYFQVTVAGGAAVRRKGKDMLALYLTMGLSGPAPWHIHGKVKFRVVGIGFSVSVDKTIGRREPQALEPAVDAEDLLLTAFKEAGSWSFTPAGGEEEPVVLRERPEGGLQVSPAGVLEVRQNALPLDLPIERVGESRPSGGRGTRYRLVGLTLGRETPGVETPEEEQQKTVEFVAVRDHFAVGQYRDMTDSERLSAPSFEEFPSGARALGLEAAQGGAARVKAVGQRIQVLARRPAQPVQGLESMQGLQAVGLESTALDPATAQVQAGSGLTASEFSGLLSGSAVGRSSRSWERRSPSALQPAPVALRGARFAVVLRGDLQASPGAPDFEPLDFAAEDFFAEAPAPGEHTPRGVELLGSRAQAQARLQALEAAEPAYRGRLQVVAEHELATA